MCRSLTFRRCLLRAALLKSAPGCGPGKRSHGPLTNELQRMRGCTHPRASKNPQLTYFTVDTAKRKKKTSCCEGNMNRVVCSRVCSNLTSLATLRFVPLLILYPCCFCFFSISCAHSRERCEDHFSALNGFAISPLYEVSWTRNSKLLSASSSGIGVDAQFFWKMVCFRKRSK